MGSSELGIDQSPTAASFKFLVPMFASQRCLPTLESLICVHLEMCQIK
jgi:hypothetical protein